MAEGGEDNHKPFRKLSPNSKKKEKNLTRDDVGNQARFLVTRFIHDRMESDGLTPPTDSDLIDTSTPTGPPVEHVREVAQALRRIGDELDADEKLQELINEISPTSNKATFNHVAQEIFSGGQFNWGRVVALFYFVYKMIVKAFKEHISKLSLFRQLVEWMVNFIIDFVSPWIISRGGWEAILEYFGTPDYQAAGVLALGICLSALFIWWKSS